MSGVLTLPVVGLYFNEIKAGTKPFEFRLMTEYWRKRIEDRTYDSVLITWGYPAAADESRRLARPWRGYEIQRITHEFFGPRPVLVYAIRVNE